MSPTTVLKVWRWCYVAVWVSLILYQSIEHGWSGFAIGVTCGAIGVAMGAWADRISDRIAEQVRARARAERVRNLRP